MEEWKNIEGFENYQISNLGNVKNLNWRGKERMLKKQINNKGYRVVGLRKNLTLYIKTVHRLVAIYFIPNPNNYPIVHHIDSNPANPHFKNLIWCTQSKNIKISYDEEHRISVKGKRNPNAGIARKKVLYYDLNMNFIEEFKSAMEASRKLGVNPGSISQCCLNKIKTTRKGIFKFK